MIITILIRVMLGVMAAMSTMVHGGVEAYEVQGYSLTSTASTLAASTFTAVTTTTSAAAAASPAIPNHAAEPVITFRPPVSFAHANVPAASDTGNAQSDAHGDTIATDTTPADEDYIACGCGCCGGTEPKTRCVKDEAALQTIIAQDKDAAQSPSCAMAGCSVGTLYRLCDK